MGMNRFRRLELKCRFVHFYGYITGIQSPAMKALTPNKSDTIADPHWLKERHPLQTLLPVFRIPVLVMLSGLLMKAKFPICGPMLSIHRPGPEVLCPKTRKF